MRHLVAIAGPIGAGKSAVAERLGRRLAASGVTTALVDLDDVAFAQRGQPDLEQLWHRAGVAHSRLVGGWFEAGVDVVIAHGPFFESRSYESLFAAAPADASVHHVLLRAPFEIALERVSSDPHRGPGASSREPDFLRATHDTFAEVARSLPPVDVEIDTADVSAADVADRLLARLRADLRREEAPGAGA